MGRREKAGASWRVAAAQMKFADRIAGNLEKIERAVGSAARRGTDVVLFPECAVTGYGCDFSSLTPGEIGKALRIISGLAARHGVNLLVGSPVHRNRRWQNCLIVFDRTGRVVHCYAKCQLNGA